MGDGEERDGETSPARSKALSIGELADGSATDSRCVGPSEARIYFCRSDVRYSTVNCLNAFNDGSRISDHAKSAFLGIGYPTILNGSSMLCIPPRQSHEIEEPDKLTAHYEHVPNSVGRHWTGNDPNHKALVCVE
jgi:hypothetical protein